MKKLLVLLVLMTLTINVRSQIIEQKDGIFSKDVTDLSEVPTRDIALEALALSLDGRVTVYYPDTDSMMCITVKEFEVYKQSIDALLQQVAKLEHEVRIQASFNVRPSTYHYLDKRWIPNPKPLDH